jgi:carbamoyltransferase
MQPLAISSCGNAAIPIQASAKNRQIGPRHPRLAAAGFRAVLPFAERYFRTNCIYRSSSQFAAERREVVKRLANDDPAYLVGISIGGFHNTGVALVELTRAGGPKIICNHEEERFSGQKHTNKYPGLSLEALMETMRRLGIGPEHIVAWLATYDYPLYMAAGARTLLEEFPASLSITWQDHNPAFDGAQFREGIRAPVQLGRLFGADGPVPLIGMPHHDCHAWFSYCASPFARDSMPVIVAVIDGSGDFGSMSVYLGENASIRQVYSNGGLLDSLGKFYEVISSTQGGWTPLSSEGRYMGAAAYGDLNRSTNPYYAKLRGIFSLQTEGQVHLNRALANWPRNLGKPYTDELIRILGKPITPEEMWNPDAVLDVDNIRHKPDTRDRLDKAAATQMVFEDALIHVVDFWVRATGGDRLVLTGGAALNAVANMRLLEHFDEGYYGRVLHRSTRLHLWTPPVPGDSGVTIGAAYAFGGAAGAGVGRPLEHAFYCGRGATAAEILAALGEAGDADWICVGNASQASGRDAVADLMASITVKDGIIAIFQGPAETGPRALGHRSILANACNPSIREVLNARVKHREAIRPLAPMATLSAAKRFFELCEGASDNDYNAYNYMVLTVRAKPQARSVVPAVIHVDGTARLQIVREHTDPVSYAYLKAIGKRIGVEIAVNTSFNVAGPIAQSPIQALNTLRRAKGMDGAFMFSEEGPVFLAWIREPATGFRGNIRKWLADWQVETGAAAQ